MFIVKVTPLGPHGGPLGPHGTTYLSSKYNGFNLNKVAYIIRSKFFYMEAKLINVIFFIKFIFLIILLILYLYYI